jgi:hypothetical protein
MRIGTWKSPQERPATLFPELDKSIRHMALQRPYLIPDLRRSKSLILASDYAGQHGDFDIITCVLSDLNGFARFKEHQRSFRRQYLTDGREMSYKKLNDQMRRRALVPFLSAANDLDGVVFTLAVDHRLPYIATESERDPWAGWDLKSWEKMLRVVHAFAFLVAGLSAPGQNLSWLTDEDDIVASPKHHADIQEIFNGVSGGFLTHQVGKLEIVRAGQVSQDADRTLWLDLLAIPDLVCAALGILLSVAGKERREPRPDLAILTPQVAEKVQPIIKWYGLGDYPLRRLFCVLKPGKLPGQIDYGWPLLQSVENPGIRVPTHTQMPHRHLMGF